MLPFPRHFSLLLYISVLVKGRLLGMTGGEVAAGDRGIPSSCTPYPTAREKKGTTCHSEGAALFAATEESPPRTQPTIAINWFLGLCLFHVLICLRQRHGVKGLKLLFIV